MRLQTISARRFKVARLRVAPTARRSRRLLLIALALSVAVHLAAALMVVLLPRILPKDAQTQAQGTVELLMVEQKGAEPSPGGQPKDSTAVPKPPEKPDAPAAEDQKDATTARQPLPPAADQGAEPALPPAERAESKTTPSNGPPAESHSEAPPVPPRSQEAPVFDLGGTDSESNAIVLGGQVLPALKDDRFRNRPPVYPVEAEIRGEHGSVVLVIHVSENGLATGVDVQESSGYDVLDQAAVTAVLKWHFRPALKEGRTVPFDMPFRFIFEQD